MSFRTKRSVVKNLGSFKGVLEILPPFGRLDDKWEVYDFFISSEDIF